MCDPVTTTVMAGQSMQMIGQNQADKANWKGRFGAAQRATVNARKAYFNSLKDLHARYSQESATIANNAERLFSQISRRGALETASAGESNVTAQSLDNLKAQLRTGVQAKNQQLAAKRNAQSMAGELYSRGQSRINQAWSTVGARPSLGVMDFLSIASAGVGARASAKSAGIESWGDLF